MTPQGNRLQGGWHSFAVFISTPTGDVFVDGGGTARLVAHVEGNKWSLSENERITLSSFSIEMRVTDTNAFLIADTFGPILQVAYWLLFLILRL